MYIAKLIKNKSELIGFANGTQCFHMPIQLIEFKVNADSLNNALNLLKDRLTVYINCYETTCTLILSRDSLLFSFGNIRDGLNVTYEVSYLKE